MHPVKCHAHITRTQQANLLAFSLMLNSGVARVHCALGQDILLRPLSTKSTEFEVKNTCKNLEDVKFVLFSR